MEADRRRLTPAIPATARHFTAAHPRRRVSPSLADPALRAQAAAASERGLCPHCLGRLFAKVETGMTHPERAAKLHAPTVAVKDCSLCRGLFDEADALGRLAVDALAPYEFTTYLVGSKLDADLVADEKALQQELGVETGEGMNSEMNREIGKRVALARPGTKVDFKDPQITALVDVRFDHVTLTFGGLFLFGRYRKFDRGIPQTVWPCRRCRGRGCETCGKTGKLYATSVQELVEAPVKAVTGATETAFHGAGREDIDARCLGTGRPFVLELKDPRRRTVDPAALEREINATAGGRVEVEGLRMAVKAEVPRVKEFHGRKTYRAKVRFGMAVSPETLNKAMSALRGCAIAQRTPARVEHRRADLVRDRTAHEVRVEEHAGDVAVLTIVGDAGLYIKELVSGDEGRTEPSVAGLLGTAAKVEELDVMAVAYDG